MIFVMHGTDSAEVIIIPFNYQRAVTSSNENTIFVLHENYLNLLKKLKFNPV